ncbi:hypothetical protein FOL47_006855 [Perkinsus chesapeaki]|uniref:Uncharacterized protein n=1 Tax=Perkinsus chesapeaki TaxID=330153 RepID=A0A7J6LP77_PERCH|nr:hypothetical protein FOL47_006855 [Perkinsus chesapeaki]
MSSCSLFLVALSTVFLTALEVPPAAELNKYVDKAHQAWIIYYIRHRDDPHRIKIQLMNGKGEEQWVSPGDTVAGYFPTGAEIDLVTKNGSELPAQFKGAIEDTGRMLYRLMRQPFREVYATLVHERWMRANPWMKQSQPELFVDYEELTELEKDKDRINKGERPRPLRAIMKEIGTHFEKLYSHGILMEHAEGETSPRDGVSLADHLLGADGLVGGVESAMMGIGSAKEYLHAYREASGLVKDWSEVFNSQLMNRTQPTALAPLKSQIFSIIEILSKEWAACPVEHAKALLLWGDPALTDAALRDSLSDQGWDVEEHAVLGSADDSVPTSARSTTVSARTVGSLDAIEGKFHLVTMLVASSGPPSDGEFDPRDYDTVPCLSIPLKEETTDPTALPGYAQAGDFYLGLTRGSRFRRMLRALAVQLRTFLRHIETGGTLVLQWHGAVHHPTLLFLVHSLSDYFAEVELAMNDENTDHLGIYLVCWEFSPVEMSLHIYIDEEEEEGNDVREKAITGKFSLEGFLDGLEHSDAHADDVLVWTLDEDTLRRTYAIASFVRALTNNPA